MHTIPGLPRPRVSGRSEWGHHRLMRVAPDEDFGFLGPVVVSPKKRKWGVGKLLVARAIEEMHADGVRSIESVFPLGDPVCERLFSGQGFRELGHEESEDGIEWSRVERILKKS